MSLGLYKRFFFSAMVTASYLLNNIFDIGSAYKDRIRDPLCRKWIRLHFKQRSTLSLYIPLVPCKTLQHESCITAIAF